MASKCFLKFINVLACTKSGCINAGSYLTIIAGSNRRSSIQSRCFGTDSPVGSTDASTLDKLFFKLSKRNEESKSKVTVVGTNEVGMATVFTLLTKGITNDICMIDVHDDKLKGEMMDLRHGSIFLNNAKIVASKDHFVSANSRIYVIAAGSERERDETRSNFVARNAGIIRAVVPELVKYSPDSIFVIASEPVDILSYVAWKSSGLAKSRVIGTGTNLDSARFRYLLSNKLGVAPTSCHGYIIGERGESSVPVWSSVNVAGVRLTELNPQIGTDNDPEKWDDLHKKVIHSDQSVRELKGYNSWATALSIADICHAILTNANSVRPVSTYVKGEHSIWEEVFLSLPCVVGHSGVTEVIRQPLTDHEAALLRKSAEIVANSQDAIKMVQ